MTSASTPSMKYTLLAAFLSAAVITTPTKAWADDFRLRIGAGHADVITYVKELKQFFQPEVSRRVQERTGHTITWVEAYGGSVAKLNEVLGAVNSGILDIGGISVVFESTKLYLHGFSFYYPFTSGDTRLVVKAARKTYDTVPELKGVLVKENQRLLAITGTGDYNLITKFPWKTHKDLAGKKIGSAGPILQWIKATGAIPVNSSLPDSYLGLQTNVYDGYIVHTPSIFGFKLYEAAQNLGLVSFGALPLNIITINNNTWRRLPENVQKIIEEVALEYEDRASAAAVKDDEHGLEAMRKAGINIFKVPQEERKVWAATLKEVPAAAAAEGKKRGVPMERVLAVYKAALAEQGIPVSLDLE